MNTIDRIRIRRKPSIIEQWNGLKINDEIIKFAIENGYRFNAELVRRFIQYPSYFNAFKNDPQFLQTIREDAIKHNSILNFEMYSKEEFVQILKNDDELTKMFLNSIEWKKDYNMFILY